MQDDPEIPDHKHNLFLVFKTDRLLCSKIPTFTRPAYPVGVVHELSTKLRSSPLYSQNGVAAKME